MNLSPEERRKIYEEEKRRIDAETAKSNPQPVHLSEHVDVPFLVRAALGLLALTVILVALTIHGSSGKKQEHASAAEDTGEYEATYAAERFVIKSLKAPSTADLSPRAEQTLEDLGGKRYKVTGWVDAQNSFGAKLRSRYTVVLHYDGNSAWSAESVVIDSP